MKYDIVIPQLSQALEINNNSFLGTVNLKYNGEKIEKISKHKYTMLSESGIELNITIKRSMGGLDMPKIFVNDEKIYYIRELTLLEKIILYLPFSFVFMGAIGGIFAGLTFMISLNITRTLDNPIASSIINLCLSIGMGFLSFMTASAISSTFFSNI